MKISAASWSFVFFRVLTSTIYIGCYTCRLRRKKCDEGHPSCKACSILGIKCEYKLPIWWGDAEQRMQQKEQIRIKIRETKSLQRSKSLRGASNQLFIPSLLTDQVLISSQSTSTASSHRVLEKATSAAGFRPRDKIQVLQRVIGVLDSYQYLMKLTSKLNGKHL